MTGLELLRHVRKASPESAVILMTAYGSKETAIEALNEGAAYYVEKPFDLDEMKVVARRTIDQKRIASENADLRSENRGLKAELKRPVSVRGACRPKRKDEGDLPAHRARGRDRQHDRDLGRVGHRKGAHRPGHPLQQRARRSIVRLDQLRRAPRRASGERAVRPHEGIVHRRFDDEEGAVRGRPRRDDLPRRDRRDDSRRCRSSSSASCRSASSAAWAAPKRSRSMCASSPRTNQDLEKMVREKIVSRGSVLPDQRDPDSHAGP